MTAVFDPILLATDERADALARIKAAGASSVRIAYDWSRVAPAQRPEGFDGDDPGSPGYDWAGLDAQVIAAVAARLEPLVGFFNAPRWAYRGAPVAGLGPTDPDRVAFGDFARAAAIRYSGAYEGLPRVRYWQVWNEPNLSLYLQPQLVDGKPHAPEVYRELVNELAAGVKSVHPGSLVIAGGTSPFQDSRSEVEAQHPAWGPLAFMRELLCLDRQLRRKCLKPVRFDVWAHHPYTSGGPTHSAVRPDDVSLGDLPEMRAVLAAGYRRGNVAAARMPEFWVTEFSWDSAPPDPAGVPAALHRRWTAEALYRMWQAGVSLVTWFLLEDRPMSETIFQSGLYYAPEGGRARAKPSLAAFRFPLVAFLEKKTRTNPQQVRVWARAPGGAKVRVVVQQAMPGGGWRRLGVVTTNPHGIFHRRFVTPRRGAIRARLLGQRIASPPFSLAPVPDRRFNPFGGTQLEP